MRRLALNGLLLALLLGPVSALAGGNTVHELGGPEVFGQGELEALSLDAEGILRPGFEFDAVPLDAPTSWAATRSGGDLWIGTGNAGDVLRVKADGTVERIETADALMVTALAPLPDGGVAAAVFPGGRLLRIAPEGDVSTLATLPVEYVWALVSDGRGALTVATGVPGAVYEVDPFGAVKKVAEVGDDHARCLARQDTGWLVGTAPKGRVLHLERGRVDVLRDLDAQEIVGVLPLAGRGVLVAANADQTGGNPQAIVGLLKAMMEPPATKEGQKPKPRAAMQDGSVLWIQPSGAVTTLWAQAKVAALSLVADGDGALLGTYPSGRLIRVAPRRPSQIFADLPEAEASVLLAGRDRLDAVVTSNPAVLHRPRGGARQGTFTSTPIDAGATARWGRIRVSGTGIDGVQFRSGETGEPDDTWSDWHPSEAFHGLEGGCGARARFLQLRVSLAGADAALRSVSVVSAAPNNAPVVASLEVKRPGAKDGAGLPDPTPVREITWKAEDPDGDALRVHLHAQRDGSPHWIPLVRAEVLAKPAHTWDTSGLPDGTYRIRLVVSDAPDNPTDREAEAVAFTAPFGVDNTAPVVSVTARVAGDRLLVQGEAVDQSLGRVASIHVSIDGGPWQTLGAVDGILDEAAEPFAGSIPLPAPGAHDVVVRARDADGNPGAGATVVTIR
jgi:hypothetical protein